MDRTRARRSSPGSAASHFRSPPAAPIVAMASCFLAASALTWARAAWEGTLRLDDTARFHADHLLFVGTLGAIGAVAGVLYFRALRVASEAALPHFLVGALVLHVVAATALPLTSDDLFAYLAYGRLTDLGFDPYLVGPRALPPGSPFVAFVSPDWLDTPVVYGPIAVALSAAFAATGSFALALAVHKAAALACSLGAVVLAFRACRGRGEGGARAFVLFAWNPLFAWELTGQAHNDGIMLLAMVAFVVAARRRREGAALAALVVALYSKFAAAPLCGLFVVERWRRSPAVAMAMAAGVAAAGIAVFAPFWHGPSTLRGPLLAALGGPTHTTRSIIDLAMLATSFVWGDRAARLTYVVLATAAASLMALVAVRAVRHTRSHDDVLRQSLLFLFVYQLVAPWYQGWYATWLLPLALALDDPRWHRLVAWFTVLQLVQHGVPLDSLTNALIDVWAISALWKMRSMPGPRRTA